MSPSTDLALRRSNPARYWRELLHRAQLKSDDRAPASLPPALQPDSAVLEACRMLRVNLAPRKGNADLAPLLLLAPAPDANCALVAAGLAVALAEERRRVLLVDADLRHPQLDSMFALQGALGLRTMISGGSTNYPPIPQINDTLWVLPAGRGARDAADLYRRPELSIVVNELAERFDTVIYSISGHWSYPDALLLGLQVGRAVLAIRSGVDTAEEIRRIKEPMERAGVQILGFTLVGGPA